MSSSVIVFPRHHLVPVIDSRGEDTGLGWCSRCMTGEGGLTEDCCGRPLTEKENTEVVMGRLDYRRSHGGWTDWSRDRELAARRKLEGW